MSAADKSPSWRAQAPTCWPVTSLLPIFGPGWTRPLELLGHCTPHTLPTTPSALRIPSAQGSDPASVALVCALGQVCASCSTSLSFIFKMGATVTLAQPSLCHGHALFYPPGSTVRTTLPLPPCMRRGHRDGAPPWGSVSPSAECARSAGALRPHSLCPEDGDRNSGYEAGHREGSGARLREGLLRGQRLCFQLGAHAA